MGKQQKIKALSNREFIQILKRNNYHFIRREGSHGIYKKDGDGRILIFAIHGVNNSRSQLRIRQLIKEHNLIID